MRRLTSLRFGTVQSQSRRTLFLKVDGTADPQRFPRGYVPLTGDESIDTVYDMLKEGHFVAPSKTIESIHNVHIGVRKLLLKELPHESFDEVVHFQRRHRELSARIIMQRDFWALEDFNDSDRNQSFGIQNIYFDNYQWSTKLWKQFIPFVARWFPLNDHSHITYDEYLKLLRSFAANIEGVRVAPLLPKGIRLHPSFGAPVPSKLQRQPMLLFRIWLDNFRKPLGLQKALVLRGGSGILPLVVRSCGVPMVKMTDPSPLAVEAARKDSLTLAKLFHSISYQVAPLFPEEQQSRQAPHADVEDPRRRGKYDLLVYYPDQHLLQGFGDEPYAFAPGMMGFRGDLEAFFEQAGEFLTESGVLAICTTNFSALADPSSPHPIEYEVKVNRRWIILDYYDRSLTKSIAQGDPDGVSSVPLLGNMKKDMKAELWILHRVESLKSFAHIHKIPGAEAPSSTRGHWRHKGLSTHRRRAMKQQVELMGGNWGEYKERLVSMLQETGNGEDEDETAEAVRMALDPTYPAVLAERARVSMERNQQEKREFHERVRDEFGDKSPRQSFDERATKLQATRRE